MKKKLSLMNLGQDDRLAQKKMKEILAGDVPGGDCVGDCVCGCAWVGQGGSTTEDNLTANFSGHLVSPGFSAVATEPGEPATD